MHLSPADCATFLLEQLSEVRCDLADVPKAEAAVRMLECIKSGDFVLVTAQPVAA